MTQANDGHMTHEPFATTPDREAELAAQQAQRNLPVALEHMPLVEATGAAIKRAIKGESVFYETVLDAGQSLIALKAAVGHGGFQSALEYLGQKERTARLWMRLREADLKSATIADLGGISAADKHLRDQEAEKRAAKERENADNARKEREAQAARARAEAEREAERLREEAEEARRAAERARKAAERAASRASRAATEAVADKTQHSAAAQAAREAQAQKDDAARARREAAQRKAEADKKVARFTWAAEEATVAERIAHRAAERIVEMEAEVAGEIDRLQGLIRAARTTQAIVEREAEGARAAAVTGDVAEAKAGCERGQAAADSLAEQQIEIFPGRRVRQELLAKLEAAEERIAILSADTPAEVFERIKEAGADRNLQLQTDIEDLERTIFGLRKALAEARGG